MLLYAFITFVVVNLFMFSYLALSEEFFVALELHSNVRPGSGSICRCSNNLIDARDLMLGPLSISIAGHKFVN